MEKSQVLKVEFKKRDRVIQVEIHEDLGGSSEQITADWSNLIYTGWLPESRFELAGEYGIQRYDERYKGVDRTAESVLEFHVPVKPTAEIG